MSSEVLRRKLFKTVLSDSRSPSGILASSPEMVETVQRRAQGGVNTGDAQYIQAIGQLAQQGDKATLQNIFADTRLPTTVRNAAREALGSLATKTVSSPTADFLSTSGQQLARMPKEAASDAMSDAAGFGQGILDLAASENRKFVDSIKTAAGNDIDRLSSLANTAADSGIGSEFMEGLENIGNAIAQTVTPGGAREAREKRRSLRELSPTDTRLDRILKSTPVLPSDMAGLTGAVKSVGDAMESGVRSLVTPIGVLEGEKMVAGGDGDDLGTALTAIRPSGDSDDLGTAPTKTVAEQVSETAVSGADTQTKIGTDRKVNTQPPTAQDIANQIDNALSGNRNIQSPESAALSTARSEFEAGADEAITNLESKVTDLSEAMLNSQFNAKEVLRGAESDVRKATEQYNQALEKGFVEAKEFTLEDVKDEALKLSGIEKENYDEDRKNAFWFNMMRAGLAVAAGESSNTLTNLAKGLGIGVEGYGKDIGTINSQEREDRKELRNLQLQLINNKNSRELALTAAENQHNYQQQTLAQRAKEGADTRLLQARQQENSLQLGLQKLDVDTAFQISKLVSDKETNLLNYDLQIKSLDQKDRIAAQDRAFNTWKTQLATVPKEFWQVISMGGEYAVQEKDGNWSLTSEGEKYYKGLIDASISTGLKVTDLDKSVRAVAQGQSIQGIPLTATPGNNLAAAGIWVHNYKEEFEKSEPYAKRSVLERFMRDAGQYLDPNMPLNTLDSIFPPN